MKLLWILFGALNMLGCVFNAINAHYVMAFADAIGAMCSIYLMVYAILDERERRRERN